MRIIRKLTHGQSECETGKQNVFTGALFPRFSHFASIDQILYVFNRAAATRFNYILDWLIFFLFVVATLSGVLISEAALPALGFNIVVDPFWSQLHDMSANLMTVGLGIHLAMHWKWIVTNVKKYLVRGRTKGAQTQGGN